LDAANPVAREDEYGKLGRPYSSSRHISLTKRERVVFEVMAYAKTASYNWETVLDVSENANQEEYVVRSNATPFRLSGYAHSYEAVYEFNYNTAGRGGPPIPNTCTVIRRTFARRLLPRANALRKRRYGQFHEVWPI
jgi:hypothetical protein